MNSQKPMNEGMLLIPQRTKRMWRPVIAVCPMNEPENLEPVAIGRWFTSEDTALKAGMKLFFGTYETRYGFKHPEDPSRTQPEPLPANLVVSENNQVVRAYMEGSNGVAW